jgi:hypothetical protein
VNCPARSRARYRESAARSPRSIRLRACCVVRRPSGFAVTPRRLLTPHRSPGGVSRPPTNRTPGGVQVRQPGIPR